jgi:CubicO group peptidase (beta-lactamase class C family)
MGGLVYPRLIDTAKRLLTVSSTLLAIVLIVGSKLLAALPQDPEQKLSANSIGKKFKEVIENFIAARGFSGAVVCIYKDHTMILNEGYGSCADVERVYPLASVGKRFTYMAVEKLIQENLLSKDDRVLAYLNLPIVPRDPRVNEITIGQLMDHKGGWDNEKSNDPLFSLDKLFPGESQQRIDKITFIDKVLSSSMLDHAPGTQEAYSNFGYLLLGEVIEKAAQMSYLKYINETFAEPLGLKVHSAKTPTSFSRETPFAGSFNLELSTSCLGLAARASDCACLISYYQINGLPRSLSRTKVEQSWLSGSLPGTMTSLMRQRVNNVIIIIFIPDRDDNCWKDDIQDLRKEIDHAANCVGL